MLQLNPSGNYHFLPGIEPYSSGVKAEDGFEIVHATLRRPLPWREGFARIEAHLQERGRPRTALCGVELRSPTPFTRQGFLDFNRGYCELIREWDLLVDGQNPVARTNVAPGWAAPAEEVLYGFSYTIHTQDSGRTFVVAGAGELRGGPLGEALVIRPGETTPDAMREKATYVMKALQRRLDGLGASWDEVTTTSIYTMHPLEYTVGAVVMDWLGEAAVHGVRWYPSRPPIDELEYEMDCRGVRREVVL